MIKEEDIKPNISILRDNSIFQIIAIENDKKLGKLVRSRNQGYPENYRDTMEDFLDFINSFPSKII